MWTFGALVVAGATGILGLTAGPAASEVRQERSVVVPPDVTAGVAVFDRQTRTFTEQLNTTTQFRSASIVKLLIVLDYLWNRGPTYSIPPADRNRLDPMLRRSDDGAASYYWDRLGRAAIINRMVSRLSLANTAPPPPAYPSFWGYTAMSAADTVKIYQYLLDTAPSPVRDYVMGNLRQATRCGTDGFDQYFGIPSAYDQSFAVKQGWSGFAISGGCAGTQASPEDDSGTSRAQPNATVDLVSEALHTTGTVGAGDRSIIAVFSLHPDGTPYGTAYSKLTQLTRTLDAPGGLPAAGSWFGTWGSGVRVRAEPSTSSTILAVLPAGVDVLVGCQKQGQLVEIPPYSNDWWAYLPKYGGYMTNIYVNSPDNKLPGVPDC